MQPYSAEGVPKTAAPVSILTLAPSSIPLNLLQDISPGQLIGTPNGTGVNAATQLDPATVQLASAGPGPLSVLRAQDEPYLIAEHIEHFATFNFTTAAAPFGWANTVSGTGAAGAQKASESGHPGIVRLQRGTTTTGRAAINVIAANYGPLLDANTVEFECWIRIDTLSDPTNRYMVRCGWFDSVSAPTKGVYMEVNDVVNVTTPGAWVLVHRTGGVSTVTDSTSTPVATAWHRLKIVTISGNSTFYVDGNNIGTVSGSGPQQGGGIGVMIVGALGTTDRLVDVDYVRWNWRP